MTYTSVPLSTNPVTVGSIPGYAQITDYTVSDIASLYQGAVGGIQTILQGTGTPPPQPPPMLQQSDADKIAGYVQILRNLLVNGVQGSINGQPTVAYMTSDMTNQLGALFTTLQSLGVTIPPNGTDPVKMTQDQANALQQLSATSLVLQSLFTFASTAVASNRSLQTIVELEFVQTGNTLLGDQLDNLENALTATQTTVNNLTTLQELHNQIKIPSTGTFPMPTGTTPSAFQSAYVSTASDFFHPIAPAGVGIPGISADPSVLNNYQVVSGLQANMTIVTPSMLSNYQSFISNVALDQAASTSFGVPNATIGVKNGTDSNGNPLYDVFSVTYNPDGTQTSTTIGTGYSLGPSTLYTTPDVITFVPKADYTADFKTATGMNSTSVTPAFIRTDGQGFPVSAISPGLSYFSTGNPSATFLADPNYALSTILSSLNKLKGTQVQLSSTAIGIPNINTSTTSAALSTVNLAWQLATGITTGFFRLPVFADNHTTISANLGTLGSSWLTYASGLKEYIVDRTKPSDSVNFMQRLVTVRMTLSAQVPKLSAITPLINGAVDPSSLLAKLKTVLNDLNTVFVTKSGAPVTSSTPIASAIAGLSNWLLDNYAQTFAAGTTNTSGQIQQNLTFAITAGQSLNTTQQETVRRFLFVFEEYYKAASAVLQQITQFLQHIAQNISR